MRAASALCWCPFQRRRIDHEAVFHVVLEHPRVRLVDLLNRDHLDVGDDTVLSTEIEHLLRFPDPANPGAGQRGAAAEQREHWYGERGVRRTYHAEHAVAFEEIQI